MPDEDEPEYAPWARHIDQELSTLEGPLILIGHSLGASILLKCLAETVLTPPIAGIFLIAAPFWGGAGWRYDGYEQRMGSSSGSRSAFSYSTSLPLRRTDTASTRRWASISVGSGEDTPVGGVVVRRVS